MNDEFKNLVNGLIENQKAKIKSPYGGTQFVTLNYLNCQGVIHKSLESARAIDFTYLLVISFYSYKYFEYTNYYMKLVAVFNEKNERVEFINMNKWKFTLFQDGFTGSYNENGFFIFKIIDRLGESSFNTTWNMKSEERITKDFNKFAEMTRQFSTYKEYELNQEVEKLKAEVVKLNAIISEHKKE